MRHVQYSANWLQGIILSWLLTKSDRSGHMILTISSESSSISGGLRAVGDGDVANWLASMMALGILLIGGIVNPVLFVLTSDTRNWINCKKKEKKLLYTSRCSEACLWWKMGNVKSDIYVIQIFTASIFAVLCAA